MTIKELFEELRREQDWDKAVVVEIDGNFIPITSVIPNIITDDMLILGT